MNAIRRRPQQIRQRAIRALIVAAVASAPVAAVAQEWALLGGVAGKLEYTDNYFFTADDIDPTGPILAAKPESAVTASVTPFLAAARRTEVSDVTALVALGGNKVWGPSEEYVSARFSLDGTLREPRSTWTGKASYSRSPALQNVLVGDDVVLALAYTDAANVEGGYRYELTDRWTLGASVGAYANWYDSVQESAALADDRGVNVGGTLGYAFSDRTRLEFLLAYLYFDSDVTRSDAVTSSIGVVHQYSPALTVSGSVGGYWAETEAQTILPGAGDPIAAGEQRRDDGFFFGGSVDYRASEQTRLSAALSQSLAPSATGTLSRSDRASLGLSHAFSERLSTRAGVSFERARFPSALEGADDTKTLQAQVGLTYALAERWKLEAGYQYTRARYSRDSTEPKSNTVFVSVGYNWPGASITGWVGRPVEGTSLQGAGPLSLPPADRAAPATPGGPLDITPFEPFTLP